MALDKKMNALQDVADIAWQKANEVTSHIGAGTYSPTDVIALRDQVRTLVVLIKEMGAVPAVNCGTPRLAWRQVDVEHYEARTPFGTYSAVDNRWSFDPLKIRMGECDHHRAARDAAQQDFRKRLALAGRVP